MQISAALLHINTEKGVIKERPLTIGIENESIESRKLRALQ